MDLSCFPNSAQSTCQADSCEKPARPGQSSGISPSPTRALSSCLCVGGMGRGGFLQGTTHAQKSVHGIARLHHRSKLWGDFCRTEAPAAAPAINPAYGAGRALPVRRLGLPGDALWCEPAPSPAPPPLSIPSLPLISIFLSVISWSLQLEGKEPGGSDLGQILARCTQRSACAQCAV